MTPPTWYAWVTKQSPGVTKPASAGFFTFGSEDRFLSTATRTIHLVRCPAATTLLPSVFCPLSSALPLVQPGLRLLQRFRQSGQNQHIPGLQQHLFAWQRPAPFVG